MKHSFAKYLFLLNLFLVTGFVNLYANTNAKTASFVQHTDTVDYTVETSVQQNVNHLVFYSTENNRTHNHLSEYIDAESFEEDNEEHLNSNLKLLSLGSAFTAIFYEQLLDALTCEIQEANQRYIFNCSKTSIRLHAKFQVFII
ncbi:hypothetical protein ACFFU1_14015 [Algibacter miyuki]|uniref:Uncharacterized protein n=1 Tax=Algibacter miyuki TaxID=1306933 RepID=A0ABV5H288_9FLAO|nr:hypothetical protein [Algibacter miyuki]MDN3664424.1 hypothetical protein [Algibacter miyuki]